MRLMLQARIACLPIAFCVAALAQAPATPQTPVQRERSLRAQVTLENWDNGGELSRFVYLNATEVFDAARFAAQAQSATCRFIFVLKLATLSSTMRQAKTLRCTSL